MNGWQVFEGTCLEWNECLIQFEDSNPYQLSEWGEKRKATSSDEIIRIVFRENNQLKGMCQVFIKIMLGGRIGLARIEGGPVGGEFLEIESLPNWLKNNFNFSYFYLRIFKPFARRAEDVVSLCGEGWRACEHKFNSRFSLILDLNEEANLSKNWRHNLKRGRNRCDLPEKLSDLAGDDFIKIFRDMAEYKNIDQVISSSEIKSIVKFLGDSLITYVLRNDQNKLIGIRSCVIAGNQAWDFLAASLPEARKNYGSYVLFSHLIDEAKRQGAVTYDLGGIDPYGNKGVYNFKRGTGARPIEYLGEWEWGSHKFFLDMINGLLAIHSKSKFREFPGWVKQISAKYRQPSNGKVRTLSSGQMP